MRVEARLGPEERLMNIVGRVQTKPIDYRDIPMAYWPKAVFDHGYKVGMKETISAVCRSMADCNALVEFFDNQPNFCPDMPVLLRHPAGDKLISGLGFSTAAELRDCCIEVWGTYDSADGAKRFDTDAMRERFGMARKEDVPAMVAEAFAERIRRHKANSITDPVRQYDYPNPTERTLHSVADSQEWKDN